MLNWIKWQRAASPLAIMELRSQVPPTLGCQRPLVTARAHARSPAAIPLPLHYLRISKTEAWQDAALPQHHAQSQEGRPDLLHAPGACGLLAGPGGILKTGVTSKRWQNKLKAGTVFPQYCTLFSH